jgi:cytoskeletal protein RodZ
VQQDFAFVNERGHALEIVNGGILRLSVRFPLEKKEKEDAQNKTTPARSRSRCILFLFLFLVLGLVFLGIYLCSNRNFLPQTTTIAASTLELPQIETIAISSIRQPRLAMEKL